MANQKIAQQFKSKLVEALDHLEYSFKKAQKLPLRPADLDEETMETWESFAARFARVSDLFLSKYLRALILVGDPGFEGALRDVADRAEKLKIINNADLWMEIRSLRNITAHEYEEDDLEQFFKDLLRLTPVVFEIRKVL